MSFVKKLNDTTRSSYYDIWWPLFMYKDKAGKTSGGSDSLIGVGEVLLPVIVYLEQFSRG